MLAQRSVVGRILRCSLALKYAAIVVVNRHGHGALGIFLAHHISGKLIVNLVRGGHALDETRGDRGLIALVLNLKLLLELGKVGHALGHKVLGKRLLENLGAGSYALIADKDIAGPANELTHLVLGLAAKRAMDRSEIVLIRRRILCHR